MRKSIQQYDIWWVNPDLEPAPKGVETYKNRPCVVLSSNIVNKGKLALICPLLKRHYSTPFIVNITPSLQNKLDVERHLDLRRTTMVDIQYRFGDSKGSLEPIYHAAIKKALKIILEL